MEITEEESVFQGPRISECDSQFLANNEIIKFPDHKQQKWDRSITDDVLWEHGWRKLKNEANKLIKRREEIKQRVATPVPAHPVICFHNTVLIFNPATFPLYLQTNQLHGL